MARLDFKLPDIGEGVTEGEIVEWFVRTGDAVKEDDPMVEVMTDKATVTIGAPCDGRVEELRFEIGSVARVGQVILTLESADATNIGRSQRSSRPPATAVGDIQDSLPGAGLFQRRVVEPAPGPTGSEENGDGNGHGHGGIAYFEAKPLATPATRRLAKETGVDLRRVRPTGDKGRVTRDDVQAALRDHMAEDRPHGLLEERIPIVGMRRKIAERMAHAKATAAHFTFVEECDASRLVEMRERLLPEAERRGVRLTYLPFIVKAVTEALHRHPVLNSAVDETSNELVYKKYYNIGVATATDAGLMVPVVHHADRLRLLSSRPRSSALHRGPNRARSTPRTFGTLPSPSHRLASKAA